MSLSRRGLPHLSAAVCGYDRRQTRAFLTNLMASAGEEVWEAQAALHRARASNRALLVAHEHVAFRLKGARSRSGIAERLEGTMGDTCFKILEEAREQADRLLALVRPELESCAAEAARVEGETNKIRAARTRILEGLKKLLEPPREGRRPYAGPPSRVIKAIVPAPDASVAPQLLEDEIDALEMEYVVGNIAGRDLAGASGTIVRAGAVITVDAYRRALAQGKIPQLIVYMRLPGEGPDATGGGSSDASQ